MITPIHQVNVNLAKRYLEVLLNNEPQQEEPECTGVDHLISMCRWIITHPDMIMDKQSRWIGFIQGVMAMRGFLSVQEERDHTRPMFHEAYIEMNMVVPVSVGVTND
jgi:hypothetical protein